MPGCRIAVALASVALLVVLCAEPTPAHAQATRGEGFVGGGPAVSLGAFGGGGAALQAGWGISNAWGLLAQSSMTRGAADDETLSTRWHHEVGAFANFDVLVVVPWVGITTGVEHHLHPDASTVRPSASLLLGLEYRPERQWSAGLWGRMQRVWADNTLQDQGASVGIRVAWRFRPGWDL